VWPIGCVHGISLNGREDARVPRAPFWDLDPVFDPTVALTMRTNGDGDGHQIQSEKAIIRDLSGVKLLD
jgi:hypothetical protein